MNNSTQSYDDQVGTIRIEDITTVMKTMVMNCALTMFPLVIMIWGGWDISLEKVLP